MTDLLKPTHDRKTQYVAGQKNTFGLMPGKEGTCPGATTGRNGCWGQLPGRKTHTCYVDGLLRCYPGIRDVLQHNTDILKRADKATMVKILDAEFTRFTAEETRRKAAQPLSIADRLHYRLHWSGDVFSMDYAEALAQAMQMHPAIAFWGYTRSFFAVPALLKAPNLMLYLSLDEENATEGLMAYDDNNGVENKRLQLCHMSTKNSLTDIAKSMTPVFKKRNEVRAILGADTQTGIWAHAVRATACPVDEGKLTLEFGCSRCKKCTDIGASAVWFKL